MAGVRKGQRGRSPTDFLGDPLPEAEAAMWAALSVPQRGKAIQRMTALDRWIRSEGAIDVKQARADAGVKSDTRMYEMGKAWREKRSLVSLGTFAGAPKVRVGRHDAALKRAVVPVVAADPKASVRKLALDLEAAIGTPADGKMLSHNTMRRYVEDELRRLARQTKAGDDLMLDCSACMLSPNDERLFTLFVILDRWTQVVLGAALGDVADSRAGYGAAARDALRRLDAGRFAALPWVGTMSRSEVVVGLDEDRWSSIRDEAAQAGVRSPIEPSTAKGRFGRYLRPLTGLRIGTVIAMPAHTVDSPRGTAPARVKSPSTDDQARLALEVDEYDADVIARVSVDDSGSPPDDVPKLLARLADT